MSIHKFLVYYKMESGINKKTQAGSQGKCKMQKNNILLAISKIILSSICFFLLVLLPILSSPIYSCWQYPTLLFWLLAPLPQQSRHHQTPTTSCYFVSAVGSLLSSHCALYDSAAMPMPWHSWNHPCIALPVTILQLIVAFFAVAIALTTFYFLLPRPTSLTACCLHYCWQIADLKLYKNVASCQLIVDLLTICFFSCSLLYVTVIHSAS